LNVICIIKEDVHILPVFGNYFLIYAKNYKFCFKINNISIDLEIFPLIFTHDNIYYPATSMIQTYSCCFLM